MVKWVYKDPPDEHNKISPGETDYFINLQKPKARLSEVAIIPASPSPPRDILLRHAPIVIPSEKNHKLAVDPNEFHSKKWDKFYNVKSGPIVRRPYIESYKTGKPDVYSRGAESLSCGSSKKIVFDRLGISKPPLWTPERESYFATASEREKSKSVGEFKDLREVLQRKLQQSDDRKNLPDLRTKLTRENSNKLREHFTVESEPPSVRDKEQKVQLLIKPLAVPPPVLNFKPKSPRMENIYKDFDKFGYLLSSIPVGNTVVSMGALEDPSKVLQKKLQQTDDRKNLPDLRTKLSRENPNRPRNKEHKAHSTMKPVLPLSRDKKQKVQLLINPLSVPPAVSSFKPKSPQVEKIYKNPDSKCGKLFSSIDEQFLRDSVVSMGELEDSRKVLQKKLQQNDDRKNLPDLRTKLTRKNPNKPRDKEHKAHCTMKPVLPPSRDKEQKVQLLIKPLPPPVSNLKPKNLQAEKIYKDHDSKIGNLYRSIDEKILGYTVVSPEISKNTDDIFSKTKDKAKEGKHGESEHKNEKDRCFRPRRSMKRQSNFTMDSPELMEHMKLYNVEDNKYITPSTDNEPIVRPKLKRQKTIDSSVGISSNSNSATDKAIKQKNDKMTNLALSSFTKTRVASNIEKKQKSGLSKKEEAQLPVFVPATERYVCWASYCHYKCRDETTFRYHLQALHCDESIYKCTHCLKKLRLEKGVLNMDSIIKHLRLHDLQLYKCSKCRFVHNLKHEVERHVFDKHTDKPARVIIVRDMCTHEKRHWVQNVEGATNYEAIQHSKQAHPGMEAFIAVPTPSTPTIKAIMRKRKYPRSAWEISSSSGEVQAKQPTLTPNENPVEAEDDICFSICNYCPKSCNTESELRVHCQAMHKLKRYQKMLRKQCLKKGSIRYKCCYCNSTGSKEVLKRHFRIEHPRRASAVFQYKCPHCGYYFKTIDKLKAHCKVVHNIWMKAL